MTRLFKSYSSILWGPSSFRFPLKSPKSYDLYRLVFSLFSCRSLLADCFNPFNSCSSIRGLITSILRSLSADFFWKPGLYIFLELLILSPFSKHSNCSLFIELLLFSDSSLFIEILLSFDYSYGNSCIYSNYSFMAIFSNFVIISLIISVSLS